MNVIGICHLDIIWDTDNENIIMNISAQGAVHVTGRGYR